MACKVRVALAWNVLFAAAGTPAAVVECINADVNAALNDPGVRAAFVKQGLIVGGGSAAEFKSLIERDSKKLGGDHREGRHQDRLKSLPCFFPTPGGVNAAGGTGLRNRC